MTGRIFCSPDNFCFYLQVQSIAFFYDSASLIYIQNISPDNFCPSILSSKEAEEKEPEVDLLEIFFYYVHEFLMNSLSDSVPVVVTPVAIVVIPLYVITCCCFFSCYCSVFSS